MKKKLLLIFIFLTTLLSYSQKVNNPKETVTPSISNLKLGLEEKYFIEKYGPPSLDSINNSTRILMYDNIKLDNNHELNSVSFRFFNKKLFRIFFKIDDTIHNGLSAKYGFKELDEEIGIYGNFKGNIKFIRVNRDDYNIVYLENESMSKLSESEGF